MKLSIGKKAPKIDSLDLNGKAFNINDYNGKKIILFAYPKDNTPTCTIEVQNFRDNYKALKKDGFEVFGISPDSIESHKKFIAKYNLPFVLLADESKETLTRYGVWSEKTLFGKTYMGILRKTFIIDEEGNLEHIIEKVISRDAFGQIKSLYSGI